MAGYRICQIHCTIFDRLIGGFVGFGKGLVLVIVITFPIQFFPNINHKLTKDSQTAPYLAKILNLINQKSDSFKFKEKLDSLNIDDAKEKVDKLMKLNMADEIKNLKKKIPNLEKQLKPGGKPLDEYSNDDLKKLKDILESVESK